MEVAKDKVVKMHYKGTLSDGSVFDSSEGREPLTFIHGGGMLIPGLEKELSGLKKGDKKSVEVKSDDAYGPYNKEAVQEVPKEQFPADLEVKEGMQLMAEGPQGALPLVVKEIKGESVVVDFNHPLAGKDLKFDVEIAEVRDATKEELEHGHAHGPGGHEHSEEESSEEKSSEEKPSEEKKE